jgi:hypothetical protein
MCVHDVFATSLSSFVCHDTVSYYDTTPTSLFIDCCATSAFCQHGMYNTTYDTPIVSSLSQMGRCPLVVSQIHVVSRWRFVRPAKEWAAAIHVLRGG